MLPLLSQRIDQRPIREHKGFERNCKACKCLQFRQVRGVYGIVWERAKREIGVPNGIRTRVAALKGLNPRPLDDGDVRESRVGNYTRRGARPAGRRHDC